MLFLLQPAWNLEAVVGDVVVAAEEDQEAVVTHQRLQHHKLDLLAENLLNIDVRMLRYD